MEEFYKTAKIIRVKYFPGTVATKNNSYLWNRKKWILGLPKRNKFLGKRFFLDYLGVGIDLSKINPNKEYIKLNRSQVIELLDKFRLDELELNESGILYELPKIEITIEQGLLNISFHIRTKETAAMLAGKIDTQLKYKSVSFEELVKLLKTEPEVIKKDLYHFL
jgi:hypothetical protein